MRSVYGPFHAAVMRGHDQNQVDSQKNSVQGLESSLKTYAKTFEETSAQQSRSAPTIQAHKKETDPIPVFITIHRIDENIDVQNCESTFKSKNISVSETKQVSLIDDANEENRSSLISNCLSFDQIHRKKNKFEKQENQMKLLVNQSNPSFFFVVRMRSILSQSHQNCDGINIIGKENTIYNTLQYLQAYKSKNSEDLKHQWRCHDDVVAVYQIQCPNSLFNIDDHFQTTQFEVFTEATNKVNIYFRDEKNLHTNENKTNRLHKSFAILKYDPSAIPFFSRNISDDEAHPPSLVSYSSNQLNETARDILKSKGFTLQIDSEIEREMLLHCITCSSRMEVFVRTQKLFRMGKLEIESTKRHNEKRNKKIKDKKQVKSKKRRLSKQTNTYDLSPPMKGIIPQARSGLVLIARAEHNRTDAAPSYTIVGEYILQNIQEERETEKKANAGSKKNKKRPYKRRRQRQPCTIKLENECNLRPSTYFKIKESSMGQSEITNDINSKSSTLDCYVVTAEEKVHVTDYLFMMMAQMKLSTFSASDRLQRNRNNSSDIALGYPGLRCRHCGGTDRGSYFPLTCRNLQASPPVIHNHLMGCTHILPTIKKSILMAKGRHKDQLTLIKATQVSFFERVWERIHDPKYDGGGEGGRKSVNFVLEKLFNGVDIQNDIHHKNESEIQDTKRNKDEILQLETKLSNVTASEIANKGAEISPPHLNEVKPPPDELDLDLDLGIVLDVLADEQQSSMGCSTAVPFEFGSMNISFDYPSSAEESYKFKKETSSEKMIGKTSSEFKVKTNECLRQNKNSNIIASVVDDVRICGTKNKQSRDIEKSDNIQSQERQHSFIDDSIVKNYCNSQLDYQSDQARIAFEKEETCEPLNVRANILIKHDENKENEPKIIDMHGTRDQNASRYETCDNFPAVICSETKETHLHQEKETTNDISRFNVDRSNLTGDHEVTSQLHRNSSDTRNFPQNSYLNHGISNYCQGEGDKHSCINDDFVLNEKYKINDETGALKQLYKSHSKKIFTTEDDALLVKGILKHGNKWKRIWEEFDVLKRMKPSTLKDRARSKRFQDLVNKARLDQNIMNGKQKLFNLCGKSMIKESGLKFERLQVKREEPNDNWRLHNEAYRNMNMGKQNSEIMLRRQNSILDFAFPCFDSPQIEAEIHHPPFLSDIEYINTNSALRVKEINRAPSSSVGFTKAYLYESYCREGRSCDNYEY